MKMELFQKNLMRIIGDHFRRYAHALRFAIGLHGAYKFHPSVKNKHYQISSGARASLSARHEYSMLKFIFDKDVNFFLKKC